MQVPISDLLKSIPGAVGIRLEEELPYTVLETIQSIEIRKYDPFTLARINVSGEYESSMENGFRALAEFIFGKNKEDKKTSMTIPVFMDKEVEGWTMSFYLPEEIKFLTPLDPAIKIERMPSKTVAAYRYSGHPDLEKMLDAKVNLIHGLEKTEYEVNSRVWWAQYDQPASLPFTKRNEALVKVKRKQ
jgi:effector-binding domain-containing protein